jgi:hypothetical protein
LDLLKRALEGTCTDRWPSALFLAASAIALGYSLHIANGTLHPKAITYLTWAVLFCGGAVLAPRLPWLDAHPELPALLLLAGGLIFQFDLLLTSAPGIYSRVDTPQHDATYVKWLATAAVVAGSLVWNTTWSRRVSVPALLAVHFALGLWMIHTSPDPFIDVYVFQRDGINELFAGRNPYAMTYPDIYGNSPVYGDGLSVQGRLTFGFPYPPLSLFLAIPGHLFGDHRYSQLAAMTASGALMAYARPGPLGAAAAALFLFTPRGLFVLEQGWTEPFLVLLLSATVFVACRREALTPYLFGLFLVLKQYLVFVVPLAWLIVRRPLPGRNELGRWALTALAIGAAVSLPLALWNVSAFVKDVVTLQFDQPFRADSLSYAAYAVRRGRGALPTWLAFIAAFVAVGLSLLRAPRTPAGFASAVALTYFGFFAFNKQAFCNYYYFVLGALCCAIAAIGGKSASLPRITEQKVEIRRTLGHHEDLIGEE